MRRPILKSRIRLLAWLVGGAVLCFFAAQKLTVTAFSEARHALEQGNYAFAIQLGEQYLTQHPADQAAMLLLARSYALSGQWAEADAYFGQVPLRDSDDFHLRARGLTTRGLWCEAAMVYEQIVQKWPMDGRALEQLARIRIQQERNDEALTIARRLTHIPSSQVAGYLIVGTIEYHMNSYAHAAEALEEVVRRSPDIHTIPGDPAPVFEWLAESLLIQGRPAEAEKYALQARELSQSAASCWLLGMARQHQGDADGARAYWEETVARDPTALRAIRELGRDSLLRQQPEAALQWLQRAREIAPNDKGTLQALIATYRRLGREGEAHDLVAVLKTLQD